MIVILLLFKSAQISLFSIKLLQIFTFFSSATENLDQRSSQSQLHIHVWDISALANRSSDGAGTVVPPMGQLSQQ